MIVDRMFESMYQRGQSSFTSEFAKAAVIRLPFGFMKNDGKLLELLPPLSGKDAEDGCATAMKAPWARPPYGHLILIGTDSEERECALFVRETSVAGATEGVGGVWGVEACLAFVTTGGWVAPLAFDVVTGMADGTIKALENFTQKEAVADARKEAMKAYGRGMGGRFLEEELVKRIYEDPKFVAAAHVLWVVGTAFALMGCRNIESVDEPPSRQMRRAAARAGKPAPFTVKTLVVRVGGRGKRRASDSGSRAGTGQPLALHWVRGHFKTFGADKPLLGRAVGTYWWMPHLAGEVKAGVVVKDYEVKV